MPINYNELLNEAEDDYWNEMSKTRPWLQIDKNKLREYKKKHPGIANEELPIIICTFDEVNRHKLCQFKDKCKLKE